MTLYLLKAWTLESWKFEVHS